MIQQREVVEVPFNLTQGIQFHPAIVLSVTEANSEEESFVAVMITSTGVDDIFSFDLSDLMFTKPLPKKSQVRLHLISYFREKEAKRSNTLMKPEFFNNLLKQINVITFGLES